MSDAAVATPEPSGHEISDHGFWTVHQGDARALDELLVRAAAEAGRPNQPFIQTTITSPPYATLVDYGSDNQIGFGQSYEDYLDSCRAVFEQTHRWTVDSGSMWIVADGLMERRNGGAPSRFIPLPFELARQAEMVGWTLREVIIWRKDRTRPWSHRGKLRNGFEYVLFFAKTKDFTFNVDRLRDTGSLKSWWVKYPERHNPWGMTPDNVWEIPIPVQGSWNDAAFRHACPFPPELVRRMTVLSSDPGDVVFDPFAGSGAVVRGALSEGRRGLGNELSPEYVARFAASPPAAASRETAGKPVGMMTQRLLELRMLKYPKELTKQILREGFTTSQVRAIILEVLSVNYTPSRTGYGEIRCTVIVSDALSELEHARLTKVVDEAAGRAPLSKFGLKSTARIAAVENLVAVLPAGAMSAYMRGRTWHADARIAEERVEEWVRGLGEVSVVPVLSPLHVQQSLEESL